MAESKRVSTSDAAAMSRSASGKKWEDYDTIKCLDGTIVDMNKLIQEQAKARAALIHLEPMFSAFAPKLHVVYTFHVDTQATDGYHLFINPQFTAGLTFEEKVFVMAHECMHCVLDHMRRGQQAGHDHERSNIAADYEVNQTLVDLGLFKATTIEHIKALINAKYSGWSYERIYDDNPAGPQNQKQSNGGSQEGQGEQGQSGSGQQGDQDQSGQRGQGQVTPADCTQMGGNTSTPGTFIDTAQGNAIAQAENYDDKAPSGDSLSRDWQQTAIQQAQKDNHKDAHGAHAKFYSKILAMYKTNTDWRKAFRKIVGRALNTQEKRQAYANKNILATRNMVARTDKDKFDATDFMTIFIDSSGSITDDMLRYMIGEVYSIALQMKPETLVLIQEDTQVEEFQVFHDLKSLQKYASVATVKGRGGNNQQKCWDFLRNDPKMKGKCSELVVMFTDGWLDQHKRDPKTMSNLCWAIIDNPAFKLENPDPKTSVVYLDTKKIKH